MKTFFWSMLPDLPVCPSGKITVHMKMSWEHWWNDTDMGKLFGMGNFFLMSGLVVRT
jgi:hypothetical protein